MPGIDILEAVLALLSPVLWVPALWRILERTGHNGAWALLGICPLFAFGILWQVAWGKWPAVDTASPSAA